MLKASFAGYCGTLRRILPWIIFPLLAAYSSVLAVSIYEGDDFQFVISAYEPTAGDTMFFVQKPSGMTITDNIITWTPTFADIGADTTVFSVWDYLDSTTTTDTLVINVLDRGLGGTFTENGSARGLDDDGMTNAAAWADYNKDGVVDVFVANAGETGTLYLGSAGGAFTAQSGLPYVVGDAGSAAWGDYDHDGWLDLYVVHSGIFGGRVNTLYHNDTTGGFTDTTQVAGVGDEGLGKTASWVDFDCDGDPDIYVVNYGGANELYSNNNNGTFTIMADSAGIADAGDGIAAAWCDFNLDNLPDFYLVNENGNNHLFQNNGDSSFTDVTTTAGVGHTGQGGAAAWGDYDNDGDFDLFLGNKDSLQVLFRNNGDNTFTRRDSTGLSVRGSARSALWIDFDMDGYQDLIVAFSDSAVKFFENQQDSTFINRSPLIGIAEQGYWTSVTWADPENSGVPDICLGRRDGPNRYYEGSQGGNYLKVGLQGMAGGRLGIGARVNAYIGSGVMTRWIEGGSGSMSEPVAHFGLGTASAVDSVVVLWPSGLRRDTAGIAVNQLITMPETDGNFPNIDSTTHHPHTDSLGPFAIHTWVDDTDLDSVTLYYSSDRYAAYYTPASMADSGSGHYKGIIPAQVTGTRVYYYVCAEDSSLQKTYDPFWAQDSVYSFSVDDSVPTVDSMTVLDDTGNEDGPYSVTVRAADNDSLETVYLVWSIYDEGVLTERDSARMTLEGADSTRFIFTGEIAGRDVGIRIDYYARAVDLAGNFKLLPATAPDTAYSFRVSRFTEKDFTSFDIERQGIGVSVTDYNRDQIPDVFLANLDTTDYLFQGSTGGQFTDVSAATLGTTVRQSTGGVWGDYNNDLYPDLYIFGLEANVLLSNDGDGTFTDITTTAGVGDGGKAWGVSWVDYDNDGLLDLLVVNKDGTDRLYHNQGDSTFADSASPAGLEGQQDGVGCCWADYDSDGDQDVFVVYYGRDDRLYRNNGDGTFAVVSGVTGRENSVSAAWYDYNNDLHLDLYLVAQNEDLFYQSNGDGTFSTVDMTSAGLSGSSGGFGLAWGDFDNSGYPDFYKTRGESGQPDLNVLYRGQADGTFVDFTYESGSVDPGEYRGTVWFDYDLDGKQDLLVNNHSGKTRLYRNIGTWDNNHYLSVRLVGTRSNAEGLGAQVEVVSDGKSQRKDMGTGTGFSSRGEHLLHFGLGSAAAVDTLVVHWPNGIVQTMFNLSADQLITINERDSLFPLITRHDTIADQFQITQPPVLTCDVRDRDSLTLVKVRYYTAADDSLVTVSMTRDSVSVAGSAFVGHWRYTMPSVSAESIVYWRIAASDLRGSTDSTALFDYSVNIDSTAPAVGFIEAPDSILPDTLGPYSFRLRITDDAGVDSVAFVITGLTYQGDSIDFRESTSFLLSPDSIDWLISVPAVGLGSVMGYYVFLEDVLGNTETTAVDSIRVEPLPGRSSLQDEPLGVADLNRMVYLIMDLVAAPSLVDSLGLDLDGNGLFNTVDLTSLLDIWYQDAGSSLMLASSSGESGTVLAGLVETEDGTQRFILENPMSLYYGVVELEVDPPAGAGRLRIIPADRLAGMSLRVQTDQESGTVLMLFVAPTQGRGLVQGSGFLFAVDKPANTEYSLSIKRVYLGGPQVIVDKNIAGMQPAVLPRSFSLDQNVPNPFNPSTTIQFALPASDTHGGLHQVRLTVFNLRGATVSSLLDCSLESGYHTVIWNGTDNHGNTLPSGVYFYRLRVGGQVFTRKMVLLK
jgi:ASPIC and UnbV/FG-GAP-like repeat